MAQQKEGRRFLFRASQRPKLSLWYLLGLLRIDCPEISLRNNPEKRSSQHLTVFVFFLIK